MSEAKKTVRLTHRLVSVDGGSSFQTAYSLPAEAMEAHWEQLVAAMDPALRQKVEQQFGERAMDRRTLLAGYLAMAGSHLVVG